MNIKQQDRREYADDWDSFIERIQRFRPDQRRRFLAEATTSGRLSMIVALAADWRERYSTGDHYDRLRAAQARIAEERRLTPVPGTIRDSSGPLPAYLDDATRAMMPAPRLHPISPAERSRNHASARRFFARRNAHWVARVQAEAKVSYRMWQALHQGGPAPTLEERLQLQQVHAAMRGPARRRRPQLVTPVGMSDQRALEIAMAVLDRQ